MARYISHAERERAEYVPLDEAISIAVRENRFTAGDALTQFRQAEAEGKVWPQLWDPPRERDNSEPPAGPCEHDASQSLAPSRAPRRTPQPGDPTFHPRSSTPTPNDREVWCPPRGSGRHPEQHWFEVEIDETYRILDDFGIARRQAKRRRLWIHREAVLLRTWGVTDYLIKKEAAALAEPEQPGASSEPGQPLDDATEADFTPGGQPLAGNEEKITENERKRRQLAKRGPAIASNASFRAGVVTTSNPNAATTSVPCVRVLGSHATPRYGPGVL